MEPFTPVVLRDLYLSLSKDDQHAFLKLIAVHCTGFEPLMMLDELPRAELWKYNSIVFGSLIKTAMPLLLTHARKLAKEKPDLDSSSFDRELEAMVTEFVEAERDVVSKLVREKVKEERDPKPRMTARDDEIVRLRDAERKTFGQIGRLLLLKNPAWCGKGGKPMSRAAVEKAYHRRKGDTDK